jgi:AraC-like DNA-binding protein
MTHHRNSFRLAYYILLYCNIQLFPGHCRSQPASQQLADGIKQAAAWIVSDLEKADSMAYALMEKNTGAVSSQDSLQAKLWLMLGTLEHRKKRFLISCSFLEQALSTEFAARNEVFRLDCLIKLGASLTRLGRSPKAFQIFQEAFDLATALDNQLCRNGLLIDMGELQFDLGEYDGAFSFNSHALDFFSTQKDTSMMAICHLNLGKYLILKEEKENNGEQIRTASDHTLLALAYYGLRKDIPGQLLALTNLSKLKQLDRDYPKSDSILYRILRMASENRLENTLATVYNQLADNIIVRKGADIRRAKEYLEKSLSLSETSGRSDHLEAATLSLCRYYAIVADIDNFIETLENYRQIKIASTQLNAKEVVEELRIIHAVEQLNATNLKLEEDKDALTRDVHFKNQQLTFLLLVLILTVVTGTTIYKLRRRLASVTHKLFPANLQPVRSGNILQPADPDNDAADFDSEPDENLSEPNLYDLIRRKIEEDALYKDFNLSVAEISSKLRRNRKDVSKAIRHYGNTSFPQLVNELRVAEARRLIVTSGTSLPISEVAKAAGFNSRMTFNRQF